MRQILLLFLVLFSTLFTQYQYYRIDREDNPEYVYKVLYLDPYFSPKEVRIIQEAAKDWYDATNHRVVLKIFQLPVIDRSATPDQIIWVQKVSPYHIDVVALELRDKNTILGYYDRSTVFPSISLVASRLNRYYYKPVVLHEIGHMLNLDHTNQKFTLMYPTINDGAPFITQKDIEAYCKKHRCKESPE